MGGAKEPDANSGGLMDVSGMAEMQAAIAAELKSQYEEKIHECHVAHEVTPLSR